MFYFDHFTLKTIKHTMVYLELSIPIQDQIAKEKFYKLFEGREQRNLVWYTEEKYQVLVLWSEMELIKENM